MTQETMKVRANVEDTISGEDSRTIVLDAMKKAGMDSESFSRAFDIPYPVLYDWIRGKTKPHFYVAKLIARVVDDEFRIGGKMNPDECGPEV